MTKYFLAALLLVAACVDQAHAANCAAYTYTLTNGQTADANQVMSNFNTVRDCGNNNLLGRSNNLSDVTSVSTSRSNLGLGAAAVENLGNATAGAVTDDGAGNLVVGTFPTLHVQVFSGNGTFTIPSGVTSATVFKFTVIGGGGAGGGATVNPRAGSGGGSGGAISPIFNGFTAGGSVTVNVGSGGSGVSGGNGNSGGATTLVYNAATIATANGGGGGVADAVGDGAGVAGAVSAGSGGGATILAGLGAGSQAGAPGNGGSGPLISGGGGGNSVGNGGASASTAGDTVGSAGINGGGGGGAVSRGTSKSGGAGGSGYVIVEWVL